MYFSVVAEDAVQGLQTQVPALSLAFDPIEKLYALYVVKKISDAVGWQRRSKSVRHHARKGVCPMS